MKYLICLLVIVLFSCAPEQGVETSSSTVVPADDYFKENVALFDARIRSTNPQQYVKELVFENFSTQRVMPKTILFNDIAFSDEGVDTDLKAGDGIYTSALSYNHDSTIRYDSQVPIRSTLAEPIISSKFKHVNALRVANSKYSSANGRTQILEITCEIEFGTKGCNAQRWGWCDSCCVTVFTDTCSVTFGF